MPNASEAAWQLAGPGWLYVVADEARAGRGLLTLLVDDLDGRLEELAGRGLRPGPVETLPGAGRKATLDDPDGNTITLAQPES